MFERDVFRPLGNTCRSGYAKDQRLNMNKRRVDTPEQDTLFELPAFIQGRITYIDVEIPKSYSSIHNFLSEK